MRIVAGWMEGVRQVPTPFFNTRKKPLDISLIVIHGISLPPGIFGGHYIDDLFTGTLDKNADPYFEAIYKLEVSTHLFINRQGIITQYVSFLDRAWHAGRSSYNGEAECNDFSVGIELEGTDFEAYTEKQYQSLNAAVKALRRTYPQIQNRIAGHSDIAPGRKTDPGPFFDFSKLSPNF